MLQIDIYGYAIEEICAGSCHSPADAGKGEACSHCQPGAKRRTSELVAAFSSLLEKSEYAGKATVAFHEADDSIRSSAPQIHSLLSAAQLSPATAVNGKVLYLGGFSPEGLLEELRKRYPAR